MALQMMEVRASVLMELIVDKLSLLDYEEKFCNSRKPPWPRLHKFYFAMPCDKRSDQFLYFVSLVSWLLSLIGRRLSLPQENTDTAIICSEIMNHFKELGFAQPSWAPTKLKQGFGDAVCSVLDSLTDLALEAQRFQFNPPIYGQIRSDDHVIYVDSQDGAHEEVGSLGGIAPMKFEEMSGIALACPWEKQEPVKDYLEEAQNEAERVAIQVRIAMGSDGKDWRTHLTEAEELHSELSKDLTSCCNQLESMKEDISFYLDKLENREKFLNKQFETLLTDYNAVKVRLIDVQQRRYQSLESIRNMNHKLHVTSDKIEKVKQKLVEKGNKISDISPLVEMKNGIQTLKVELQEMEVRVGVLEHTLLQNQLNQSIEITHSNTESTV